jgi:predicted lactoylglutathione lyase
MNLLRIKKNMTTNIYINLPVKDLQKTIKFFTKVGYTFNKQFTDKNATCMIISKNICAMLITEKTFKTFTKKKISDAQKSTEVIIALQYPTRKEVDIIVKRATQAGGKPQEKPKDHGWMYQHGFQDLDGHLWEVFCMNPKKMPK